MVCASRRALCSNPHSVKLLGLVIALFVRNTGSSCALGAFYRRLYRRAGAAKAITATAHKIARIFDHLWTTKQSYQDLGADYYEQQYRQRVINNLSKKAQSLGFQLVEASSA